MPVTEHKRYALIKKFYLVVLVLVVGLAFLFSLLNASASGKLNKNLNYDKFLADLKVISSETHFTLTPGHAKLQVWLEETIREIGGDSPRFNLQIDEFNGSRAAIDENGRIVIRYEAGQAESAIYKTITIPPLKNFIVTLRGTASRGKALMIASHYDGALGDNPKAVYPATTDAGVSVAAMLEVMRYAVNNPVENDVIFFINDGEERGLLGAKHYMESLETPAEKIGLVANFEATGTSGTLVMFETGRRPAGTVHSFAKVIGTVFSNSLAAWIYEKMPNRTDMAEYKKHGLAGLNFACAGSGQNYHTPNDSMENLNEALAKQTLNVVLSMYKHYGNYDFSKITGDRQLVYFSFYHIGLIILPVWAVYLLVGLMYAGIAAVMVLKRGDFSRDFFKKSALRHLKAAGVTLLSVWIAIASTCLISIILNAVTGVWMATKYSTFGIVFGTMLIAMILFTIAQFFLCRVFKVTRHDVFVFAAIWQFLLTAALVFALPVASFLFLLPALLNVAALALENAVKNKTANTIIKDLHLPILSAAFAFTTVVTLSILISYAIGTKAAPFVAVMPLFACFQLAPMSKVIAAEIG